jgi:hypothetical protein
MTEFRDATFACFALQQPVSLDDMAELTPEQRLLMATARSPEWFAAAASSASRLSEIAPELHVLDDDTDPADVSGIDLVWLYAPELRSVEDPASSTPDGGEAQSALPAPPDQHPPAVQISLLRELSDFDD